MSGGQRARVRGGDIAARQVHAVGANRQRHIRAMVDQQPRRPFAADRLQGFAGELLQFPDREVFLTQLNVIDTRGGSLANGAEKLSPALRFTPRKLASIRYVVSQHRASEANPRCADVRGAACPRLQPIRNPPFTSSTWPVM